MTTYIQEYAKIKGPEIYVDSHLPPYNLYAADLIPLVMHFLHRSDKLH